MLARTGEPPGERAVPEVVAAVGQEARRHAGSWFPSLDAGRVEATLGWSRRRPRCELHEVLLDDGAARERVVVKVRCDGGPGGAPGADRPVLAAPAPATAAEMARLEHEGLGLIARAVPRGDARFGVVRPLALLPDHAAVVMDHVAAPPMRSLLMAATRLDPRRRAPADLEVAFSRAGALLRGFHGQRPARPLPARQQDRDALLEVLEPYVRHLGARTGDRAFFTGLGPAAAELVEQCLPARLPLAVGHGDLVVRNLLVSGDGRVHLIDPMPRWSVPPYEDLARFVVGFRMLGLQVATAGAAFGGAFLDGLEAAFLRGWSGADPVPAEAVRAYSLVVLLDKWSSAVGRPSGPPWRRALGRATRWSAHRSFRAQAERLLAGPARQRRG